MELQRKAHGTSRSRAIPTLKSRHRPQNKRWRSAQIKDILAITMLGGMFVWLGCLFLFYAYGSVEESSSNLRSFHISPGDRGIYLQKRFRDLAARTKQKILRGGADDFLPHLSPRLPILPVFPTIPESDKLRDDTLNGKPTITGIVALLQHFISEFHNLNKVLSEQKSSPVKIIHEFFQLVDKHLLPFDVAYRGRTIFPVREDGSIFMSLAAFREHLLKETLMGAFTNAEFPDKLFIGVVVQNCFGRVDYDGTIHTDGNPCKTGVEVVGKNKYGQDMTKVSDAPPDKNGIEEFCALSEFKKYCESGQVRVMYVHEPEAVGPAMARYYASKLWGGETYFVQLDSHLLFAKHWDTKYIAEVKATSNYPKSVLSTYPPGFQDTGDLLKRTVDETPGERLCTCGFSQNMIEQKIIRIGNGKKYEGGEKAPTQIPFMAAGFFFAHAEFLSDVPFDPFMPWCFMGEEIALSVRAWTSGWNIYAPRRNLIAHQYRPGRLGLPKFWEGVNRLYQGSGANNNNIQGRVVQRVKHLVGYADSSLDVMEGKDEDFILKEQEHYGLGRVRGLEDYMNWTGIDMQNEKCKWIEWCSNGDLV